MGGLRKVMTFFAQDAHVFLSDAPDFLRAEQSIVVSTQFHPPEARSRDDSPRRSTIRLFYVLGIWVGLHILHLVSGFIHYSFIDSLALPVSCFIRSLQTAIAKLPAISRRAGATGS
jgi:hypothetical protein